ncbi:phospholipase D family protein [Cronobacter turicensis]
MSFKKNVLSLLSLIVLTSFNSYALSINDLIDDAKKVISPENKESSEVITNKVSENSDSKIAIGFSPEGSAQNAIIDLINSAQRQIRVAAYSFTSPVIVKSLIRAKQRGIDVRIVVDENGNKSKSSVAAMSLVKSAKIPLRTISKYAIHHDKFIVVDGESVETGSFNYSSSANSKNSENAIVLYNMPQVAKPYLSHWESRWQEGTDWQLSY